jgi:hypothetical protein
LPPQQEVWFNEWWSAYWLRKAKKAARLVFGKQIRTAAMFERVMAATSAQASEMLGRAPQHRPHGATWLNQERWEDETIQPTFGNRTERDSNDESSENEKQRLLQAYADDILTDEEEQILYANFTDEELADSLGGVDFTDRVLVCGRPIGEVLESEILRRRALGENIDAETAMRDLGIAAV